MFLEKVCLFIDVGWFFYKFRIDFYFDVVFDLFLLVRYCFLYDKKYCLLLD